MKKSMIILLVILISILVLGIFLYSNFQNKEKTNLCTKEAKICLNGSLVYREGKDCIFPECSRETTTPEEEGCYALNVTKTCSDGTKITVTAANCKYSLCPDVAIAIQKCPLVNPAQREINCVSAVAIEFKDDSLCDFIGYRDGAEHCTADVFIAKGDITECGRLRNYDEYCEQGILNKTK